MTRQSFHMLLKPEWTTKFTSNRLSN